MWEMLMVIRDEIESAATNWRRRNRLARIRRLVLHQPRGWVSALAREI